MKEGRSAHHRSARFTRRGFTPEEWATYVARQPLGRVGSPASGATEVRTANKQVHVPRFTGNGTVGWYSELEPITEGCPPGDELVLTPRKAAALCLLGNETVTDSNPSVLNAVGQKMVRSVALEADRAMFTGTGAANDQPLGLLNQTPALPGFDGAPNYAGIVSGAGPVRAAGGTPDVVYINPADLTALQLAPDGNDRPLVGDTATGIGGVIAGLAIWPTPATPAGTAIVADASQIIVSVREDASVAVSEDYAFNTDGTVVRVVARVDVGVNDPDGLAVVKDTTPLARERRAKSNG